MPSILMVNGSWLRVNGYLWFTVNDFIMPKNLFFVESIYTPLEGKESVVTLLSTENEEDVVIRPFSLERLLMHNHRGSIREGWYVYYNEENKTPFGYGNLSAYARHQFHNYYEIRESLAERIIDSRSEEAMVPKAFLDEKNPAEVISYHVNVGHGNCSFILIEAGNSYQLWLVDCSIVDKTDHWRSYQANIDKCLKAIKQRLGLNQQQQLHIERFFLTHAHHDHYSGVEYLVNSHLIDDRTICYVNLYYQMATNAYNKMLAALNNASAKIVEPISGNSNDGIFFLHPECRLYRSRATVKGFTGSHRIVGTPINNSSAVMMFRLGGRSMVFTGDLEQNGFKSMTCATTCSPALFNSNYYTISHHGSINGHPTMPCMNPIQPVPITLDCVSNDLVKAILMGRDGAFPGIYSFAVVNYWSGASNRLEITEKASHYLELSWGSGTVTYH